MIRSCPRRGESARFPALVRKVTADFYWHAATTTTMTIKLGESP